MILRVKEANTEQAADSKMFIIVLFIPVIKWKLSKCPLKRNVEVNYGKTTRSTTMKAWRVMIMKTMK